MPQNAALFTAFSDLNNLPSPEQLTPLLEGVDVNAPNDEGDTLLYCAIQAGNLAVSRVLLEHGAKLQLEEQPEKNSKICRPFDGIDFLLLNFCQKKPGFEDPQLAVDFLELCVQYAGEDILNSVNKYSQTILHFLALHPHPAALAKVLSYDSVKFTLPSPNNGHRTPLVLAIEKGNMPVAQLMVDKGASLNHYTSRKDTPVFKMMQQENTALFDYTVAQRVDAYGVPQVRLNNIGEAQITVFAENNPAQLAKLRNLGCLEYRPFVADKQELAQTVQNAQNVHSAGSVLSMYDSLQRLKGRFAEAEQKRALGAIFGVAAQDHYSGRAQPGISMAQIASNLVQSLPQVRAFYAQQHNGAVVDDAAMVQFVAEAAKKSLDRIPTITFIDTENTPNGDVLHKNHKEALALIWLALRDDAGLPVMVGKSESVKTKERVLLHNALWFNLAKVLYEYTDAQACASGLYGAILSSLSGLHTDVTISPETIQAPHDMTASVITKEGVSAVLADLLQGIYANVHTNSKQLYVALKVLDEFADEDVGFKTLFQDKPTSNWSPEIQQFLGKVKAKWAQDFKKYYPAVTELDKDVFLALEESLRACNLSDLLLQTLQEQLRLCLENAPEGTQDRILNLIAGNAKPMPMFAETMIPVHHWCEALKACSTARIQQSGWYTRLSNSTVLKKVLLKVQPDLLGIAPVVVPPLALPTVVASTLDFSALTETAEAFKQGQTKGVYSKLCHFLDNAVPVVQEHILKGIAQATGTIANIALNHWEHALMHRTDGDIQKTSWYTRFADSTMLGTVLQKTRHAIVERRSGSDTGSVSPAASQSSGSPKRASPVVADVGCRF